MGVSNTEITVLGLPGLLHVQIVQHVGDTSCFGKLGYPLMCYFQQ